jgi:hypothetical protein
VAGLSYAFLLKRVPAGTDSQRSGRFLQFFLFRDNLYITMASTRPKPIERQAPLLAKATALAAKEQRRAELRLIIEFDISKQGQIKKLKRISEQSWSPEIHSPSENHR